MDSVICADVNSLINSHCNLKNEFNKLKKDFENNEISVIDLENKDVILEKLIVNNITSNNITGNNATFDEELNSFDITCKNITVQNNTTVEDITCSDLTADNITTDNAKINNIESTDGNIKNIYSDYTETQTLVVTSDKNLKKEITDVTKENLKDLKPVRFKYINNDKKYVYGLIAQEVEQIYPDMVYTLKNGNKSIDYNQLISLLILKTNNIEERLISIEKAQASIKTFTGLLILAFFIIVVLLLIPRDYLNLRFLLKVLTKK